MVGHGGDGESGDSLDSGCVITCCGGHRGTKCILR